MKPVKKPQQLLPDYLVVKLQFVSVLLFLTIQPILGQQINPDITSLPQRRNDLIELPDEIRNLQRVSVPRLIGRDYNFDEVVTLLNRAGLQMGEAVPVGNNDSIGIITRQQPAAGQRVIPQSRINVSYGIEVSSELSVQPDLVTVPRYIGLTVERAVSRMPNDRLILGQITEIFSEEEPGIIIGQFPEPEMEVDPQTPVSLEISMGPPPEERIEVPELVGRTLREAAELLQKAGLIVGDLNEEPSADRARRIINHSPSAGSVVLTGTPVNITYSVPEELIIVPDVRGMLRNEAILSLKEAALGFYFEYNSETGAAQNTIIGQEPRPGSRVPPGSDILLVIAEKEPFPPWVIWTGGILAAALLGGFAGSKLNTGKKKKIPADKNLSVHLKPIWDNGKQTVKKSEHIISGNKLYFKYLPDSGIQNIKTS